MKSICLKTIEIAKAYKLLAEPVYQNLGDADRVKLWKISRKLFPIATKYAEEFQSAQQSLKPSDETMEKFKLAMQYEEAKEKKTQLPMTEEEYQDILKEWKHYQGLLKEAMKDIENKENALEIEPLSDEAVGKLMSSNKWTFAQMDVVSFIVE